jgi:hypothetical protein
MNRRRFLALVTAVAALPVAVKRLFGKAPESEYVRAGFRFDPRKGEVKYYLNGEELPGPVFPSGETLTAKYDAVEPETPWAVVDEDGSYKGFLPGFELRPTSAVKT